MGPNLPVHRTVSCVQPATSVPDISEVKSDLCQLDLVRCRQASSCSRLSRFAAFSFAMMSASVPDRRSLSLVCGPVGAYLFCLDCRTWIGKKRISFLFRVEGELRSEKPGNLQSVRVQAVSLPVPGVTKLVGRNGQMCGVYGTVELDGGLATATPIITEFRVPFGTASMAKEVAD